MPDTEILTRIFDRLGNIDARLAAGSVRHDEFKEGLARLDTRMGAVEDTAIMVKVLKPIVEDYRDNKNKATGIAVGIFLVFGGLSGLIGFFANELKTLFTHH